VRIAGAGDHAAQDGLVREGCQRLIGLLRVTRRGDPRAPKVQCSISRGSNWDGRAGGWFNRLSGSRAVSASVVGWSAGGGSAMALEPAALTRLRE
jgi:hypothetical protein